MEIVDESCGKLVAPDDANALSEVLRSLITDPQERAILASGGYKRALALCHPARQLTQLHDILSQMIRYDADAA
jgi:glycosyltransferase involved in cell wall biosynthesis